MITARIMHVPQRACPNPLVLGLAAFSPMTMIDEERRGPWWNARRCWLSGAASHRSHVLVVQDDAELVPGFRDMALAAVEARPREIVSFFYRDHRAAKRAGEAPWIDFPISCWGVALCMPSDLAKEFVAWSDKNDPNTKQDDLRLLRWAANTGRSICATNPSLVEHRPEMCSVVHPGAPNKEFTASNLYRDQRIRWSDEPWRAPGDRHPYLLSTRFEGLPTPDAVAVMAQASMACA